jgi:hypothetical protein
VTVDFDRTIKLTVADAILYHAGQFVTIGNDPVPHRIIAVDGNVLTVSVPPGFLLQDGGGNWTDPYEDEEE